MQRAWERWFCTIPAKKLAYTGSFWKLPKLVDMMALLENR